MKKVIKILFVGPLLPPIHGQSLAFTRFYESIIDSEKLLINTNMEEKNKIGKILGTFSTIWQIIYNVFFEKIDKVYFTCSRSFMGSIKDIFLVNLASFKNIKLVNHLHGSNFYDFLHSSPKWYQKILFNTYGKVDTSIVLLDSMKNQFKDFPDMKLEVVPNFYDNELNKNLIEKDNDMTNLLYLSNIIKSKGIFELIEAFDELSKKYENIYLNIAGGFMGDEYMSITKVQKIFLEKVEKNSKINYIGKVFAKEKVKLLQKSDIFILPSYKEAVPISILEAMRSGNAIVTTRYKYLPEVVKSQNGILVEAKSVESLMDGINKLLEDNELLRNIQEYNKKEAEEKYSLDKYLDRLNKIVLESI